MGWLMGIEPTYAGITIRCVNHFATATIVQTRRQFASKPKPLSIIAFSFDFHCLTT